MATVSRSGADYYDVRIGLWTNWSRGQIQGSTLTVTRQNGNLLVAFVALFVAASGKSLWRLLCFLLHRYLSTPSPQDGLYHQRQAILRNSETPEEGAWRLLQLLWVWRKKARRPLLRLLPPILLATFLGLALVVGGIFSSQVASDKGSEVLITGNNCGPLDSLKKNDDSNAIYLQPFITQKASAHANYAVQCYSNATNSEDCNLYVKPRLSFKVERNASCPFAAEMCKTQNENIRVDTGYIDSQRDLGLNTPESERFEMRHVYQCAPIVSEGFKRTYAGPKESLIPEVVQYFYGNLTYGKLNDSDYTGFTYEVFRNFSNKALPAYSTSASSRPEFQLGAVVYFGGDTERGVDVSEFQPIPQLERSDADVSILFLSTKGLRFVQPVDDLWYSAHDAGPPPTTIRGGVIAKPAYTADEPASGLACAQQFQMCNPHKPKPEGCEPLNGAQAFKMSEGRWSKEQEAVIQWADKAMYGVYPISNLARFIGSSLLIGRYSAMFGVVGPLPSNLWQVEVENMIGASLASLQGSFVLTANGPPTEELKQFSVPPEDDTAKRLCRSQKIISTRYSSFSVLGLAIIFCVGVALIFLDLCLEPIINSFHAQKENSGKLPTHYFTGTTHSRLEWRATSVLQLQRLAHAAVGSGTWFKTADETPVTLPFQNLGVLDVSDTRCPVYRPLSSESEAPTLSSMASARDLKEKNVSTNGLPQKDEDVPPSPASTTPRKMEMRRVRTGLSETTLAEEISPLEAKADWRTMPKY